MIVETDSRSGFCFGVQNAVEIAEKALSAGEEVYSLGPIVHNDMEVKRLASLGLISVNHEEFRRLSGCKVLIRAHGEPPETYNYALENNIEIIEATCPIVKKLQSRIESAWHRQREKNGQIVIFGKTGHAEIIGLMGQINNEGIVVSTVADLDKVDLLRPVSLFSQTTMSKSRYKDLADLIKSRMKETGAEDPDSLLTVNRTICGEVSNREPHLKGFASKHDVVIFVSGLESSNGRQLYNICKDINPYTYFISSPAEVEKHWLEGKNSVGICGATSTPRWLIENVRQVVEALS